MRRLSVILTVLVPLLAAAMEFPDSVKPLRGYDWKPALHVQQAADSLTGLWVYPDRGMIVGIEKHTENISELHSPTYYRIVAVESADKSIDRGTIVGLYGPCSSPGRTLLLHLPQFGRRPVAHARRKQSRNHGKRKDGAVQQPGTQPETESQSRTDNS